MIWRHFCGVLLFSNCLSPLLINAWWDEGHMLIAAIAKQQLTAKEISTFDAILNLWQLDYPGQSNIITAAVWADHIKCTKLGENCQGLPNVDAIEIFNQQHVSPIPYNPYNIGLPPEAYARKYYGDCFLERVIGSLMSNFTSHTDICELGVRNRHLPVPNKSLKNEENPVVSVGSKLGWNLHLRLLIHIYGDIHQPLHSILTYSPFFPRGDGFGHLIQTNSTGGMNLHMLWDSGGRLLMGAWPDIDLKTIEREAKNIAEEFAEDISADGVAVQWPTEVADESYKLAVNFAYTELLGNTSHGQSAALQVPYVSQMDESVLVYSASEYYVKHVQYIARRQIAFGGHRLGRLLRMLAPFAEAYYTDYTNTNQLLRRKSSLWMNFFLAEPLGVYCFIIFVLVTFLGIAIVQKQCKARSVSWLHSSSQYALLLP